MFSVVSFVNRKETAACDCKRLSEKVYLCCSFAAELCCLLDESIACTCYAYYVHTLGEGAYVNAL